MPKNAASTNSQTGSAEKELEQNPGGSEAKAAKVPAATTTTINLKPGEVYLELKSDSNAWLITTKENWENIYSKQKDDPWELKEEKKR